MLANRHFYVLWFCYAVGTLAGLTAIGMTASFAVNVLELPAASAALAVAVFGILNGVGRPLFGALHDSLGTRRTISLSLVLIAVGAGAALLSRGGLRPFYYLGFGLFWLMLGGWLAIAPAATTRLFGRKNYAQNYGIMFTAYGVGALGGGGAAAFLFTRFESHAPLFIGFLGLALLAAVVSFLLLPRRATATLA
jgi:OFA family oxalate/formate antiporter-like MFS transporter